MINKFLSELRHRRVLRSSVAYAIAAAAAVEFTDIVTPVLNLPVGLLRGVIIVALAGFPIVVVIAWFFDLTPDGIVRGASSPKPSSNQRAQMISILLIVVLAISVVYLGYRLHWENQSRPGFERGKSIAVLPFSSISADGEPETAYFSRGVSEEIINALSKVEDLRVAARTSSFAFQEYDVREVGEALNVSVVLEGSVRRAGDQVRISAQLIDTANGFQLWSDVYDHELKDVFLIQEKIAHAIVKALKVKLSSDAGSGLITPGTENTLAYDKYLEGRGLLQSATPAGAQNAIEAFEEASELDPNYAQAYAGLADAWIMLREVGNLSLREATERSHAAISTALQLNNLLPEAQAALGRCILGGGEHSGAARQFLKAIDLDPDYSEAYILRANLLRDQGYLSDATRVYTQALALDPLNPAILENQVLLFAFQGRFDQAIEQLSALETSAPDRLTGRLVASQVWAMAGDNVRALDYARRAAELSPDSPVALAILVDSNVRLGNLREAQAAFLRMHESAPDNETAIEATMRYYLLTGDLDSLNQLAASRIEGFIDNEGFAGTEIVFERASWAATAQLALGNVHAARELLEKAIPDPAGLDPRPDTIRSLALLARARKLDGNPEGATEIANHAEHLVQRALTEGWDENQLKYTQACVAASVGSTGQALEFLRNAIETGWNDFVFADHDPILANVVQFQEYRDFLGGSNSEATPR